MTEFEERLLERLTDIANELHDLNEQLKENWLKVVIQDRLPVNSDRLR